MGTEFGERALGDVLAKLVEGKGVEASALIANTLVTVLTTQFLGPGAPVAGKVTEGAIKRFANLVGKNTRDFLEAGKKLDDERAARAVLQEAISNALDRVRAEDGTRFDELGDQGQEQFLQLISFTKRNVVEKLDLVLQGQDRLLEGQQEAHVEIEEILRQVQVIGEAVGVGGVDAPGDEPPYFEGPRQGPALSVPDFTGRERDMEKLVEQLTAPDQQAVCVVASGIGGVGKTALVQHFVATVAKEHFPEGAAWMDGAQLDRDLRRVAKRFGWNRDRDPSQDEARSHLAQRLRGRPILLVVDNVPEDADSSVIRQLPLVGGRCRSLFTSRRKTLHLDLGAPVSPLDIDRWPPDVSRAYMRATCGAACIEGTDAELDGLAGFVGNLPLAVRLVAKLLGRCRSPAELLRRLQAKPLENLERVATGTDRGVAATFLESCSALDEGERRTLLALSVCAQGTRSEIVAKVSGIDLDATDLALEKLEEVSLAERAEQSTTPWGLHDVVRMFLSDQPGRRELEDAHVRWVQMHCERHAAPEQHGEFERGVQEAVVVIRRLLAKDKVDEASEALYPVFRYMQRVGRVSHSMELAEAVLAKANPQGVVAATWLGNIGLCHQSLGNVFKAIDNHEQALSLNERLPRQRGRAANLGNLGACCQSVGQVAKAIGYLNRALALNTDLEDSRGEATTLANLGACHMTLGEVHRARGELEQALALSDGPESVEERARCLCNLAGCHATLGENGKASQYLEQAYDLYNKIGSARGKATALENIGACHCQVGETEKGLERLNEALVLHEQVENAAGWASTLGNIGACCLLLGDIPQALDLHRRALELNEHIGSLEGQAVCLANLGVSYSGLGKMREAVEHQERSLALNRKLGKIQGEADNHDKLGEIHAHRGHNDSARKELTSAAALYRQVGLAEDAEPLAKVLKALAKL